MEKEKRFNKDLKRFNKSKDLLCVFMECLAEAAFILMNAVKKQTKHRCQ